MITDEMKVAAVKAYTEVDGKCRPAAMQKALEAALSTLPIAGEGKVKALEWGKTSYGNPEAHCIAGAYRLNRSGDGGWYVSVKSEVLRDTDGRSNFATLDKAKAAAQSDFETRILSALVWGGK